MVDSARAKLRFQLAVAALILGMALVFIAYRFQTETHLVTLSAQKRNEPFERVWFTDQEAAVGARLTGRRLTIHRWAGGGERQWNVDLTGEKPQWITSPSLAYVAWLDGWTLQVQPLGDGSPRLTIPMPAPYRPLALGALSDDSVAVAFDDAVIRLWDARKGEPAGESSTGSGTSSYESGTSATSTGGGTSSSGP